MSRKKKTPQPTATSFIQYVPIILIPFLGLVVYANSFRVPFVFDDMRNIVHNPLIQSFRYFIHPNEAETFPGYRDFMMRYVGFFSFALNYWIHGLSVFGYHVLNWLIHIANAFAVYYLIRITAKTPVFQDDSVRESASVSLSAFFRRTALFSACLFVVHPLHTQAVTYIVQRFASLATMFYLLALLFFIRWRLSSGKTGWYIGSILLSLLAVKTKPVAITIPITLLIYEWLFFRATWKRRLLDFLPYGITSLVIPLSYLATASSGDNLLHRIVSESKILTDMTRSAFLFTELRVVVTYIRLLFLPVYQNFDYDYPIFNSFWNVQVVLSFCFLAAIVSVGIFLYKKSQKGDIRYRVISFGIYWFFLTLLPESGLIPIVDVIYEHRLYLPSVGAFLAISSAVWLYLERNPLQIKNGSLAMILAVVVFGGMAFQRNWVWQSELSLWEDALKKSPNKIRVLTNLGSSYLENNQIDRALELLHKAETIDSKNDVVFTNIATAYYKQSFVYRDQMMFEKAAASLDRSIEYYEKAMEIDPHRSYLQTYLEGARQERGRYILKKQE